jgi:hypothetical protein
MLATVVFAATFTISSNVSATRDTKKIKACALVDPGTGDIVMLGNTCDAGDSVCVENRCSL